MTQGDTFGLNEEPLDLDIMTVQLPQKDLQDTLNALVYILFICMILKSLNVGIFRTFCMLQYV